MSDKKFAVINSKLNKPKARLIPRKVKFDGTNDLSQIESKLTNDQKEYIDAKLYCLHDTLEMIDGSLNLTKGDLKTAKEYFIKTFEQTFNDYYELLKAGSQPDRAKFILKKSLRDTLVKLLTGENEK